MRAGGTRHTTREVPFKGIPLGFLLLANSVLSNVREFLFDSANVREFERRRRLLHLLRVATDLTAFCR